MGFIYRIKNTINDKLYIGKSREEKFSYRFNNHKNQLNRDNHSNPHLQNSWNKYGEENFLFEVMLICENEFLNYYEKELIDKYNTINDSFGYNKTLGGEGGKMSEETKRKLSEAHIGRKRKEKSIEKMKEAHKGVKNPSSKLSRSEVRKILKRINNGESHTSISNDFNISRSQVSTISRGEAWNHINVGGDDVEQ